VFDDRYELVEVPYGTARPRGATSWGSAPS